ncbi:hypothetical protein P8452_63489 [Trifolium repens]|nr:hypothetical protein P8452_63489 [Trifolium repens]
MPEQLLEQSGSAPCPLKSWGILYVFAVATTAFLLLVFIIHLTQKERHDDSRNTHKYNCLPFTTELQLCSPSLPRHCNTPAPPLDSPTSLPRVDPRVSTTQHGLSPLSHYHLVCKSRI